MRGSGRTDPTGSGLPFAKYRDLAVDQIRLIAAQQLWLGSTDWPLQLDFYTGSFFKDVSKPTGISRSAGEHLGSCCPQTLPLPAGACSAPSKPRGGWPRLPWPCTPVVQGQPVHISHIASLVREAASVAGMGEFDPSRRAVCGHGPAPRDIRSSRWG